MNKLLVKFVAPLAVGAAALVFAGAPTAGALSSHATDASFVGTYKVKLEVPGDSKFRPAGKMVLNADGTSPVGGKKVAHWSNDGQTLTVTLKIKSDVEVLTIVQSAKGGLGSKKAPGTITVDGQDTGAAWFAVKAA